MNRRQFLQVAGMGAVSTLLAACNSRSEGQAADTSEAEEEVVEDTSEPTEPETQAEPEAQEEPEAPQTAAGPLVVYFSWSGNTAGMATRIAEATGGQLFELVPTGPYPEDYDDCTEEALAEQQADTLRPYQGDVEGWDAASVVYLGYPIWWMDLPQITKKFIDDHDWNGKTVVPFSTYYSSGWAGTPQTIADTCSGATVAEDLSLAQGDPPGAYDQIEGWIAGLAL